MESLSSATSEAPERARPGVIDAGGLREWLRTAPVAGGTAPLWPSWTNPGKPGFPYEEATAWVLRCSRRGLGLNARSVAAARDELGRRIEASGGLRAHGRLFAFDTAVALGAFEAATSTGRSLVSTVAGFVRARRAVEGGPVLGEERPDTRWSEAFGAHLLWLNRPLREAGEHALADDLTSLVLPRVLRHDGLLRIHGASDRVYSHAMAYALDGLVAAGAEGRALAKRGLVAMLDRFDGRSPLAAFVDEPSPRRADVTAQCAALARQLVDDATADALLAAVARLQDPSGGLYYESGSADLNTCAAVFALEALPA